MNIDVAVRTAYRERADLLRRGLQPRLFLVGEGVRIALLGAFRTNPCVYVHLDETGTRLYLLDTRVIMSPEVPRDYIKAFTHVTEF